MTEPFDPKNDTWRCIWEALAMENGDDPDAAIENHKKHYERTSEDVKLRPQQTPSHERPSNEC